MNAVLFDHNGKVVAVLKGPAGDPSFEQDAKAMGYEYVVCETPVGLGTHYVAGGVVYPIPKRPSEQHEFDFATKTWVFRTAELNRQALRDLRITRNDLLTSCDWTQLPDNNLSEVARNNWREYRQELRDLPSEYPDITSITEVTFPTPPSV